MTEADVKTLERMANPKKPEDYGLSIEVKDVDEANQAFAIMELLKKES